MSDHTHPNTHSPEPGECPACDVIDLRVAIESDNEARASLARVTQERDAAEAHALALEAAAEGLRADLARVTEERDEARHDRDFFDAERQKLVPWEERALLAEAEVAEVIAKADRLTKEYLDKAQAAEAEVAQLREEARDREARIAEAVEALTNTEDRDLHRIAAALRAPEAKP